MRNLLALSFVLFVVSCQQAAQPPTDDAVRSLKESDALISRAVAERDLEKIVAFYADDAVLLPAAVPQITGKAGIREEWEHTLAIPNFENKTALTKVEVAGSGDLGYTMGTYSATMMGEEGELTIEPGKWLTVWKRQSDGRWLIAVDTYNTDIPPPDHK